MRVSQLAIYRFWRAVSWEAARQAISTRMQKWHAQDLATFVCRRKR